MHTQKVTLQDSLGQTQELCSDHATGDYHLPYYMLHATTRVLLSFYALFVPHIHAHLNAYLMSYNKDHFPFIDKVAILFQVAIGINSCSPNHLLSFMETSQPTVSHAHTRHTWMKMSTVSYNKHAPHGSLTNCRVARMCSKLSLNFGVTSREVYSIEIIFVEVRCWYCRSK